MTEHLFRCHHCGELFSSPDRRAEHKFDAILDLLKQVADNQEKIMTDQEHLDQDVQAELTALDAIEAEIAALKGQPGATALDFTALDAVVARMQGDATPPAPAAPADGSGDTAS